MRRRAMATVGFIGTGLLGSAMVERMVRRCDSLTVWNRTEAKARAHDAARRRGRRRHPRQRDAAPDTWRDRRRPFDDIAARHEGARPAAERGRREIHSRAGVHVTAD